MTLETPTDEPELLTPSASYQRFSDIVYRRSFRALTAGPFVYHVANDLDQPDLWVLNTSSGERRPVTRLRDSAVKDYWLTDDGRFAAILADAGPERPTLL